MRVRVRSLKRFLIVSLLTVGALSLAGAALADYTGPDRDISTFSWERLVCDYQAVYDPPGAGYYGCGLTLYEPPDGNCESNVDDYFTSSACGWPAGINCNTVNCDVSRNSSVDGCNQGQPGCRAVERIVSQPPATTSGNVTCGFPGSGGWCRGDADLSLSGSEPLSGYTILALEGTHNGATFACPGGSCDVGLLEGGNDFSFWAVSSYGDTSNLGSASGSLDSEDPSLSGSASGTPGDNGWYVSSVTVEASAGDGVSGLASLDVRIDGGGWSGYGGPVTIGPVTAGRLRSGTARMRLNCAPSTSPGTARARASASTSTRSRPLWTCSLRRRSARGAARRSTSPLWRRMVGAVLLPGRSRRAGSPWRAGAGRSGRP
ncbi:MAG: Ig-like bact protein [Anaerolineales bacterium]|nr:Ig-like bact protein [Anaerolineales bacterium]